VRWWVLFVSSLLLDWIAPIDVGNVVDAFTAARSLLDANEGLELHLLLNAGASLELAQSCRGIARVNGVASSGAWLAPEARFADLPRAWDYMVQRPRAASEPAEQHALREQLLAYVEVRRWAGTHGVDLPSDGQLQLGFDSSFELDWPAAAADGAPLLRHGVTQLALALGDAADGSDPTLDFWCRLGFALRSAFPDARFTLLGQSIAAIPGVAASALTRTETQPLFESIPELIDGYDLGLWPTLGLLRDADVLIAPPSALARLTPCAGTRWLVLANGPGAVRIHPRVPFTCVDAASRRSAEARIVDVVRGVGLLLHSHFGHQAALALEQLRQLGDAAPAREVATAAPAPPVVQASARAPEEEEARAPEGARTGTGRFRRRLGLVATEAGADSRAPERSSSHDGGRERRPLDANGGAHSRRDLFCAKPFQHFEIQHNGRAYLCCPSWMPEPLGNVTRHSPLALWNGPAAQRVRRSILDGSFRYCTGCPFLSSATGPVRRRSELSEAADLAIVRDDRVMVDRIALLNLAYDRSCNLSCPTCRTEVIVASGRTLEGLRAFQAALLTPDLLRSLDCLYVTGSGDPFASAVLRELLRSLDAADYPHLRLALHTNALLFTEENWALMRRAQPLVSSIEVSIDAATEGTYIENRRGGDWQRLLERLEFLRRLRTEGPVQHFKLSFVVQANNWREMGAFVRLARRFDADTAQFTALASWGTFSPAEFARRAVHLPSHPEHADFSKALSDDADLRDPRVLRSDFMRPPQQVAWPTWHA
jgi:MoaA/NifB/PqqE/SkfB family radical SAM enzyme